MNLIENLVEFFKKPEEETKDLSPEGLCPVCWGYQEYDKQIRKLFSDKQIDVNNHKDSYTLIKGFVVSHIDGIKTIDSQTNACPDCINEDIN